jgi:hypothetical protein
MKRLKFGCRCADAGSYLSGVPDYWESNGYGNMMIWKLAIKRDWLRVFARKQQSHEGRYNGFFWRSSMQIWISRYFVQLPIAPVSKSSLQLSLGRFPVLNTLLQILWADFIKNIYAQTRWEIIPGMSIQCRDLVKNFFWKREI